MGKLRWTDLIRQPERRAEVLQEARPAKGWSVGMSAWGQLRTPAAILSFVRFRGQSRHGFRAAEGPFISTGGHSVPLARNQAGYVPGIGLLWLFEIIS